MVDDSLGIVLGYPTPLSSKLSGYNVVTGEKMWTTKVSHEKNWGWNEVADGLFFLHDENRLMYIE